MTHRWRRGDGRRAAVVFVLGIGLAALSSAVAAPQDGSPLAGGATTVFDDGPTAFGRALANLDPQRWNEFRVGKQRFTREWRQRGPWADAAACADCHYRDGRGPKPANVGLTHLLRLGRAGGAGDPVYGTQLRRVGYGVPAPGQFTVEWQTHRGRYLSGEPFELRRPVVRIGSLAYGPLDSDTRMSLRVPPAVFGLGLLEGVPDAEIVSFADADDADGDGISGRPHHVRDASSGRYVLGRFGWKASQPSLAAQSAAALANDLGVANPLVIQVSRSGTTQDGEGAFATDESEIASLVRYLRALAVPARRQSTNPVVREGETIFAALGCSACHRPRLETGVVPGWAELSGQSLGAYTDLLLHDMGPDLADEVGEGAASAREWRTPPLWGLGLLQTVSGQSGLLHDGRARSTEEAVLWHGGEADISRQRFVELPPEQRKALLLFLATL